MNRQDASKVETPDQGYFLNAQFCERLLKSIPEPDRSRGHGYFQAGFVDVNTHYFDRVYATVRGDTGIYSVELALWPEILDEEISEDLPEDIFDDIDAFCNCPRFDENGICKHISATLLTVSKTDRKNRSIPPNTPQQKIDSEEQDFLRKCVFKIHMANLDYDEKPFLWEYISVQGGSDMGNLVKEYLNFSIYTSQHHFSQHERFGADFVKNMAAFFKRFPVETLLDRFRGYKALRKLAGSFSDNTKTPQHNVNSRHPLRFETVHHDQNGTTFLLYNMVTQVLGKNGNYSKGRKTDCYGWQNHASDPASATLLVKLSDVADYNNQYHFGRHKDQISISDTTVVESLPLLEKFPVVGPDGSLRSFDTMPGYYNWSVGCQIENEEIVFQGSLLSENGNPVTHPVLCILGLSQQYATDGYRFYRLREPVHKVFANMILSGNTQFDKNLFARSALANPELISILPDNEILEPLGISSTRLCLEKSILVIEPYADLMVGHLEFSYQSVDNPIPQFDAKTTITLHTGQKTSIATRDIPEEKSAVQTLHDFAGPEAITSQGGIRLFYNGPESLFAITEFCHARGWTLRLSKSFKYRIKPGTVPGHIQLKSVNRFIEIKPTITVDGQQIEMTHDKIMQALNGKGFFEIRPGEYVKLSPDFLSAFANPFVEWKNGVATVPEIRALTLPESKQDLQVDSDPAVNTFRKRLENLATENSEDAYGQNHKTLSRAFRGTLRTYQKTGLQWLGRILDMGFGGCLADDMGLGKTVQVIAHLQNHYAGKKNFKPTLIVMPTSLLFNWNQELNRFAPKLKVAVFHGLDREESIFKKHHIVLTTYGITARDERLSRHEFELIVLDESQAIKNANTRRAKAVFGLKAEKKLALTGTPIENNLEELWSQFEFLNPGLMGNRNWFFSAFRKPIETQNDKSRMEILRRLCQPFVLRRRKADVLKDLPPRVDQVVYCSMGQEQALFYEAIRQKAEAQIKKMDDNKDHIQILALLTRLRQAAIHPQLIEPNYKQEHSSKIEEFEQMLSKAIANGNRVLIFSQFTRFLAILRLWLDEHNIPFCYLDGQTQNRQAVIGEFKNGQHPVFLLSLKAGGVGLNLTEADMVFHMDPWWNPAVENQASDRAHRIGQTKTVFNYKFVTKDTIEERIVEMQAQKAKLFDSLLEETEFMGKLSKKDFLELVRHVPA